MKKRVNMVLCEDDEVLLSFMERKIEEVSAIHNVLIKVNAFSKAEDALAYCKEEVCDFALLDIGLPGMDGFQLSKRINEIPIQERIQILFTSAIEDVVYQTFQYGPFDFVRKGHLEDDMEEKIGRLLRENFENCFTDKDKSKEKIDLIRGEEGCIYLWEVCFFKSERNHLNAFTRTEIYRCRGCLKSIAEKYSKDLLQTDKQHLVNMREIKKIRMYDILLRDGRKVPLSRRRRKQAEKVYFGFMTQGE